MLKVLSDEGKRKQYDTFGMAGDSFAGQGPFGGRGGASKLMTYYTLLRAELANSCLNQHVCNS